MSAPSETVYKNDDKWAKVVCRGRGYWVVVFGKMRNGAPAWNRHYSNGREARQDARRYVALDD